MLLTLEGVQQVPVPAGEMRGVGGTAAGPFRPRGAAAVARRRGLLLETVRFRRWFAIAAFEEPQLGRPLVAVQHPFQVAGVLHPHGIRCENVENATRRHEL